MTIDDLIDFTPELRAEALKIAADYTLGPLFTPPTVVGENGKKGVLQMPSAAGGANWGGAGFDPEIGLSVPAVREHRVAGRGREERWDAEVRVHDSPGCADRRARAVCR